MNKFERELINSFKNSYNECNYLCTKLVVNKQLNYGIKSPCDFLIDVKEKSNLAIEAKECALRGAFPFDRVEEHQIEGLKNYKHIGRKSYICICYRKWNLTLTDKKGLTEKEIKAAETKRAYAIDIDSFVYLKESLYSKGIKSISTSLLEENSIRLYPKSIKIYKNETDYSSFAGWDISVL